MMDDEIPNDLMVLNVLNVKKEVNNINLKEIVDVFVKFKNR